jgi:hypothetical protein
MSGTKICWVAAAAVAVVVPVMTSLVGANELEARKSGPISPEQQARAELLKSKGPTASLTVLPVRLAGNASDRLTEVVGLLLEQQGLQTIELGKTAFSPDNKPDMQQLAGALGEFVQKNSMTTEYALYAEFNGDRDRGLVELRALVVDQTGAVVWGDRQTPDDEGFRRLQPREPMTVAILLAQRLSPQLNLNEATRQAAQPGKMARLMEERSGMPPADERTPLPGRQAQMKATMPKATLVVFPPRVRTAASAAGSVTVADLVTRTNAAGLCKAEPAQQDLALPAPPADPNEMKVLWDSARQFREYLRKNPANADYVLFADFAFDPLHWERGFVHFVVCDRKGDWVIVDMQNSHHGDYQTIKPTSREACHQLVVKRLEGYLR